MGRKLKRQLERKERIDAKKTQIIMSPYELAEKKQKYAEDYNKFTIEQLMVCVALAERRLWKFGEERLMRTLHTVDELMGDVYSGEKTIDDYIAELKRTAGIEIRFDK